MVLPAIAKCPSIEAAPLSIPTSNEFENALSLDFCQREWKNSLLVKLNFYFFYNLYIKNLIPREQKLLLDRSTFGGCQSRKIAPCLHCMLLNKDVFPTDGLELSSSHQSSSATGCVYKWNSQKPRNPGRPRELFSSSCAIEYLWRHLYPSDNPWTLIEKTELALELEVLAQ